MRLLSGKDFPIFKILNISELEADVLFSPSETSLSSLSVAFPGSFLELIPIEKLETQLQPI